MCVVSMIGDYYGKWILPQQWTTPYDTTSFGAGGAGFQFTVPQNPFTPEQVEAIKKLLEAAQKADEAMGEANCEDPAKTEALHKLGLMPETPKYLWTVYYWQTENSGSMPDWDERRHNCWDAPTGKLVGEIRERMGRYMPFFYKNGEFYLHNSALGQFMTLEHAQKALETYLIKEQKKNDSNS